MPRLRFKNFSDLGFIQGIDKPRFLVPLLLPHKGYFARQGLDVTKLKNDDAEDRRLLKVFTQPDGEMPTGLLESLYMLDDLADETGRDRILAEAERQRVQLHGIVGHDLSSGEFAIAVQQAHPSLIRVCHEKTVVRKIKNYEEYQAEGDRPLTLKAAQAKVSALEEAMAPWFESKDRSRACEIYVYREGNEIKFLITHGRPYLTDGSWSKKLKRSRVGYRPQKHDSVVYDTVTRVLKVNAQTLGEKELYRTTIGQILFDDTNYFPGGDLYTLAPLRQAQLAATVGIDSVRLTEVWIRMDDAYQFVQISRAYDLLPLAEKHGILNLAEGEIIRASFLIKYRSGGRARKLEVRTPNVAIYDRDRDGEAAEAFLRANRFLKTPSADA